MMEGSDNGEQDGHICVQHLSRSECPFTPSSTVLSGLRKSDASAGPCCKEESLTGVSKAVSDYKDTENGMLCSDWLALFV